MKSPLLLAAIAALALSACSSHDDAAGTSTEAEANTSAPAPVALPPMLSASKTYRCADSSLVYVDYMSDSKSVHIHPKKDQTPIIVPATDAENTYSGDGWTVKGTAEAGSVQITQPGGKEQSCKA